MKRILPLLALVIVVAVIAVYLSTSDDPFKSREIEQTDFVISDTASIGRIVIADRAGKVIRLERKKGDNWELNGKYPAREDAVDVLLSTFKNVYIQRPVPKEAQEQVNTVMASGSKKVEIYDRDGALIKIWYVGHATMDKKGTYMLLETPRYGKSSSPFIMDMKGFIGMLNTRFFTNENEWRSVRLLSFPNMDLESVEIDYPREPGSSFRIEYAGGNEISLYNSVGDAIAAFDTAKVKDYMLNFKLLSFENYRTGLSETAKDSIRSSMPYQVIRIEEGENKHEIKLWPKIAPEGEYSEEEMDGEPLDPERIYGTYNAGEMALAQRFIWDRFRAPLQAFTQER
jgi:hypothetical protein